MESSAANKTTTTLDQLRQSLLAKGASLEEMLTEWRRMREEDPT